MTPMNLPSALFTALGALELLVVLLGLAAALLAAVRGRGCAAWLGVAGFALLLLASSTGFLQGLFNPALVDLLRRAVRTSRGVAEALTYIGAFQHLVATVGLGCLAAALFSAYRQAGR
ncbi:MAG: hypothetical protein HY783_11275 [Chloroflexi bacterium]|nr:hypothetical protein [Chloroflexota bacterium]